MVLGGLGSGELIILLFIFFMLFGAERLPKVARALGKSKGEFHHGLAEVTAEPDEEKTLTDLEADGRTPEQALKEKAESKGIETVGRDTEDIKADIAAAGTAGTAGTAGSAEPAGEEE
jgi:sec-independent protein translocase protein TatA